jgi:hypothetical protein
MNTKLSILFYIKRAKTTSQGKSPIYLRVTVDSKQQNLVSKDLLKLINGVPNKTK